MQEDMNGLPGELQEMERRLAGLSPAPAANRDAMLFAAGQAAGKRAGHVRLWQGLCGSLAAAALLLIAFPRAGARDPGLVQHAPQVAPALPHPSTESTPSVEVTAHDAAPRVEVSTGSNYLVLRNVVLAQGVGALPRVSGTAVSGTGGRATDLDEDLKSLPAWERRLEMNRGDRL